MRTEDKVTAKISADPTQVTWLGVPALAPEGPTTNNFGESCVFSFYKNRNKEGKAKGRARVAVLVTKP